MNIVWTAAGDYSFTPAFLSFFQDGTPDFYMNSIIGYVRKWYEPEIINRLFDLAGRSFSMKHWMAFCGLRWKTALTKRK